MNAKASTDTANWWELPAQTSIPIPENTSGRAPSALALPLKGVFTADLASALEGKQPHRFIPQKYWVVDRKPKDPAKAGTPGYQKAKIRGQFNEWVKEDEKTRSALTLIMVYRTGTEEGFPEPGVSYWLTKG